ncbi:uncharacterized protein LOC134532701 [Bacillus rossius redtenbacheri]|uniref:uncharacterized protein LOC134532701 n=1 Tax=Bacillus rossius redtenbacheri TaxID=93214 RepID=UPI002FDE6793
MILGKEKVSSEVRKRLLFGEVISTELKESVKRTGKSHNSKKMLQRVVAGRVLKKYRMLSVAKKHCNLSYLAGPVHKNVRSHSKRIQCQARGKVLTDYMKNDVTRFFENDDVSRIYPGKKDCLTKNGVKKQKRLLSNTLQNLHKKFSDTVSYGISYASFCRLKPFWIVTPKHSDREMRKCIIHANTELLVAKLYEEKIFQYKNPDEVLLSLCCDSSYPKCLRRMCNNCKEKCILYEVPDAEKQITLKKWGNEEVTYLSKGTETKIKKMIKKEVATTCKDLVIQLETTFNKYMNHVANIVHQYKEYSKVKSELTPGTVVLHVDFSENYACKYNEKIQSVHFGGGRQQIILHTGVLYSAGESGTSVKSFCSISPSLRHDTVAVWSHLQPVFQWAQDKENLHTVHILSDGAGSQYKNKTAFYIMSNFLDRFLPTIENFTWNFSESGHGKGAPDGVGGCLKRTADRLVAEGKDVSNFETFVKVLEDNCKGVKLFTVKEKEIESLEEYLHLEEKKIEAFKGTLQVHQVVYCSRKRSSGLQFRSSSCFSCQQKCVHFFLGEGYKSKKNMESYYRKDNEINGENESEPNGSVDESGFENTHYEGITKNVHNYNIGGVTDDTYSVGEWVLVNYDGIKYPGEITSIVFEHAVEVSVMHPAAGGTYKWPTLPDRLLYNLKDVVKKISGPCPSGSRAAFFVFKDL